VDARERRNAMTIKEFKALMVKTAAENKNNKIIFKACFGALESINFEVDWLDVIEQYKGKGG